MAALVDFALTAGLQLIMLLRTQTGRMAVTLRRDLGSWATEQAWPPGSRPTTWSIVAWRPHVLTSAIDPGDDTSRRSPR